MVSRAALVAMLFSGCSEPDDDGQQCPAQGEPAMELRHRSGEPVLVDGGRLDAFWAVQGGIFTEIDVRVTGLSEPDVESLRFEIVDANTGEPLASADYSGSALPWLCAPDPALLIENTPVGFGGIDTLDELDDRPITLEVVLTYDGPESPLVVERALTLETV